MKQLLLCATLCAAALASSPRGALADWPPESLTNLQVLPEDIPVRDLTGIMRGFAGGLGVRCTHCHLGDDPNDLASIDFASDAKIEKRKAREMLRMVRRINDELLASMPERSDPPVVVTCRTCHRSLTRPVDIRDLLVETFEAHGTEATIARYRELREEHYGSGSYDFRHFVLVNVAERIADRDPAAALRLLEFNGELHPHSGQTFGAMARIHRERGDVEAAIRSLERAVEAEPEVQFYRRLLERLREQRTARPEAREP